MYWHHLISNDITNVGNIILFCIIYQPSYRFKFLYGYSDDLYMRGIIIIINIEFLDKDTTVFIIKIYDVRLTPISLLNSMCLIEWNLLIINVFAKHGIDFEKIFSFLWRIIRSLNFKTTTKKCIDYDLMYWSIIELCRKHW